MGRLIVPATILSMLLAQQALASGAVGVFGGINRANLSGDAPENTAYNTNTGLSAGVVIEMDLSDDFILQLTPMYVQRGTNIEFKTSESEAETQFRDLTLDYFSIPILAKFTLGNGVPYISGGLDLGFLLNAELSVDDQQEDVNHFIQDFDVGAIFAFGLTFDIGAPQLTFEARYTQSIMNIAESDQAVDDSGLPLRFRSTGMQFLAGILLPFGK